MALISTGDLAPYRAAPGYEYHRGRMVTKAVAKLSRILEAESLTSTHDIFLSHKFSDAEELIALYDMLMAMGYRVYVDWKDDPELDRTKVTPETATQLRERMVRCRCLFFATTSTHAESKWMPWELGYKDGQSGRVAICPVVAGGGQTDFKGTEYLGIYPYVDKTGSSLWIHRSPSKFVSFNKWLEGEPV